jgi:uncharacterized Zn finger protein (UPF0148 family)
MCVCLKPRTAVKPAVARLLAAPDTFATEPAEMDEPALQVECPHCGATFNVADGPGGRMVQCPVCGGAVTVLDVQEEAPETATAAEEHENEGQVNDYFARRKTEEPDGPCLLCCTHEQKLNPLEIGPVLRSVLGLSATDAAHQVTHGMGIVAEGLTPHAARGLAGAFRDKGVEVFVAPAEGVPREVEQVRIFSVHDVDGRGLHLQMDAKGTIRGLKWDSVVAGVCTRDLSGEHTRVDYEHKVASSYVNMAYGATYSGTGLRVEEHREPAPIVLTLVLHDGQGNLHAMKVTPQHVRYAYLGERIRNGHDLNFAAFLTDVGRHARAAYFPLSYVQVAGGNPLAVREVTGRLEYDNYLRWAVCCAIARSRGPGPTED